MAVSTFGPVTPQYNAITITAAATTGSSSQDSLKTGRVLVPKGTYTVVMQEIGNVAGGASASLYGNIATGENLIGTLFSFDADTGRPGNTFHTRLIQPVNNDAARPLDNIFVLAKDSFVAASVYTGGASVLSGQRVQLTLIPTYAPWSALPTVGASTNAVVSSTSSGDVNVYGTTIGYDYDTSTPFVVIFQSSSASGVSNAYQSSSILLYRYNASTNTWTSKQWSISAGGTSSWYSGSGFPFDSQRPTQYFIKNNYLHILSNWGTLVDSSYRYGWIKGDISVAGSTLSVVPGHTNTAFGSLSSSLGSGSSGLMVYYWDKRNGKVIYNGGQSATFNGTWSTYGWVHNWAQWDIATNTVEYSNVNGTVDPRIAGSATYLGYIYGVPDSISGVTRAAGINGTYTYRATFSRTGSYTGVGNYQTYRAYWSAQHTAGSLWTSNNNKIEYLDSTYTIMDESATTRDFATANYEKIPYSYIQLASTIGQNQATYQLLVMPNTIYVLQSAYMKMSSNGETGNSRMGFQATIFQTPKNSATLNSIMASGGGVPTTTYVPGINNGSGA